MFLNISPTVTNWTSDNNQFSLIFEENPLADFVELPDDGRAQDELWFSNILCGVLRGSLEMVRRLALDSMNVRSRERKVDGLTQLDRSKCRSKRTSLAIFSEATIRLRCGYP